MDVDRGGHIVGAAEGSGRAMAVRCAPGVGDDLAAIGLAREAFRQAVAVLIGDDIGGARARLGLCVAGVAGAERRAREQQRKRAPRDRRLIFPHDERVPMTETAPVRASAKR